MERCYNYLCSKSSLTTINLNVVGPEIVKEDEKFTIVIEKIEFKSTEDLEEAVGVMYECIHAFGLVYPKKGLNFWQFIEAITIEDSKTELSLKSNGLIKAIKG